MKERASVRKGKKMQGKKLSKKFKKFSQNQRTQCHRFKRIHKMLSTCKEKNNDQACHSEILEFRRYYKGTKKLPEREKNYI